VAVTGEPIEVQDIGEILQGDETPTAHPAAGAA